MASQSLERRQLGKVVPLKTADFHHGFDVTPPVLSSDLKIAKAQLRLWRKSIKTAKEERFIEAAKEIGSVFIQELIRGGAEIVSSGFNAAGQIGRGIAENPDPIAQGVDIAGLVFMASVFVDNYPKLVNDLGLNWLLGFAGKNVPNPPYNTPSGAPYGAGNGRTGANPPPPPVPPPMAPPTSFVIVAWMHWGLIDGWKRESNNNLGTGYGAWDGTNALGVAGNAWLEEWQIASNGAQTMIAFKKVKISTLHPDVDPPEISGAIQLDTNPPF